MNSLVINRREKRQSGYLGLQESVCEYNVGKKYDVSFAISEIADEIILYQAHDADTSGLLTRSLGKLQREYPKSLSAQINVERNEPAVRQDVVIYAKSNKETAVLMVNVTEPLRIDPVTFPVGSIATQHGVLIATEPASGLRVTNLTPPDLVVSNTGLSMGVYFNEDNVALCGVSGGGLWADVNILHAQLPQQSFERLIERIDKSGYRSEPTIRGKGIPVWAVASYVLDLGLSFEEVVADWEGEISVDEVKASMEYCQAHPEEIEQKRRWTPPL